MSRMAFRLCRSPGAQVTSPTLLVVLQRRRIGLQGGRLKEGRPPFPAVIISYVPSYVNAAAGSWVRDRSGLSDLGALVLKEPSTGSRHLLPRLVHNRQTGLFFAQKTPRFKRVPHCGAHRPETPD